MASSNNKQLISIAKPHTIKKFELIESYIETWVQKLLNNPKCKRIVFIDCMCNSGVYQTTEGETVYGTPVRVARILRDAAGQYPSKQIYIYLNDNDSEKIEFIESIGQIIKDGNISPESLNEALGNFFALSHGQDRTYKNFDLKCHL